MPGAHREPCRRHGSFVVHSSAANYYDGNTAAQGVKCMSCRTSCDTASEYLSFKCGAVDPAHGVDASCSMCPAHSTLKTQSGRRLFHDCACDSPGAIAGILTSWLSHAYNVQQYRRALAPRTRAPHASSPSLDLVRLVVCFAIYSSRLVKIIISYARIQLE